MSCSIARQNTETRLKAIGLSVLLNGLVYGDLRPQSLVDNFVAVSKHVWHNDEKAQKDAIEAVVCEFLE